MTVRAIIIGLLAAIPIAAGGYINDRVWGLESLTAGHLIPVSVFGLLILAIVLVNPALFRLRPRLAFRPAEVGVAVMMALVACSLPGRGLFEQFTGVVAMPAHWNTQNVGWRKHNLIGYVPHGMLVSDGRYDDEVMKGFLTGLRSGDRNIGLDKVPWAKWQPTLLTWLPLILLMAVCSVCLSLIVHRQWSSRERLRYPIADFATSLMQREPDKPIGPVFRNRLFWIGLGVVLGIRVCNGLNVWFPENTILIDLNLNFRAFEQKYPIIPQTHLGTGLTRPTIYPIAIAFSFFLASEISLTMGLSQWLFVPLAMVLTTYGYEITSGPGDDYMSGGPLGWQRFGSYLAFGLIVLYAGRRYYWALLKQTFTFRRQENVEPYAAWACRILLVAMTAAIGIIIHLGLQWTLAVLTIPMMLLMFVCVSRIAAETGLFFIQPRWQPMGVFLGLFGIHALGPQAIIVTGLLCAVLSLDPSQGLMPFLTNGLKMCENLDVKPARTGWTAFGTFAVCLAVALPVVLWANYNWGLRDEDWPRRRVPVMAFNPAEAAANKLKAAGAGVFEASEKMGPVQRILNINPDPKFIHAGLFGFLVVLVFSTMRLRFSWWPLHPVMFLLWATWPMHVMFHSFLLGWFVKTVVTKVAGHGTYRKCKTLMIGVIVGDLLGAAVFMIVGGVYFGLTGLMPKAYTYFPR